MDLKLNVDLGMQLAFDKTKKYDVLIVGSGPAGLSAALYSKRKGLEVGVIGRKNGGQVVDTTSVENYLGFEFETGEGLVKAFNSHVNTLKVPMLKDVDVVSIEKSEMDFELKLTTGEVLTAKAVILATGSKPRHLDVEGEVAFSGKGVAYCAICDGPLFEGLDVIVAGGGNSAVEAAIDLSKIVNTVTVVHRSQFRADKIIVDKLMTLKNVRVMLETEIIEVYGEQLVKGVRVKDKKTGDVSTVEASGVFVEIGYLPNSDFVKAFVALNNRGEVTINALNETSVPGIYAAGDVTDTPYKQIIVAASEGAKAALSANDYINRRAI